MYTTYSPLTSVFPVTSQVEAQAVDSEDAMVTLSEGVHCHGTPVVQVDPEETALMAHLLGSIA